MTTFYLLKHKSIILLYTYSLVLLSLDSSAQNNLNSTSYDNSWVTPLKIAYESLNKERSKETAELLMKATSLMPKKNWENYLVAATIYASHKQQEKSFNAIEKAIESGFRDPKLLQSLPDFEPLRSENDWKALYKKTLLKKEMYEASIQNPNVLRVLEEMWANDQKALSTYEQNTKALESNATINDYESLFEPVRKQWAINRKRLDSIIDIHGWPGFKLVGEDGAKLSWAIPQHHPDIFYKERCLSLIKKSVENGDNDPNYYAELKDRIARDTWQKQIYGCSMAAQAPYPIKDPANVDKRRKQLGLKEPVEIYALAHGIEYEIPSTEEAKAASEKSLKNTYNHLSKFDQYIQIKNVDSAIFHLKKAIQNYGDLSNKELYISAKKLATFDIDKSNRLIFRILRILIYRRWEDRFKISDQKEFEHLQNTEKCKSLLELLDRSK